MTPKSKSRPDKQGALTPGERTASTAPSALRHIVEIKDVPDVGVDVSIRADAAERAAVAKDAGLIGVGLLEADLTVSKQSNTKFRVSGPLRARVVQACVVSLEPVESEIHAEVAADFAVQKALPQRGLAWQPEIIDTGSPSFEALLDAPDLIIDGRIDLGALVAEFLVLNLDPYPRKPGANFEDAQLSSSPDKDESPFAVLKKLKREE